MSAITDLIDIELLINAKNSGMGAFNEAEGGLRGIGMAAVAVGAVVGAALVGAAAVSMDWAAQFQQDLTLIHTQAGDTTANLKTLGAQLEAMAPQVGMGPDALAQSLYHVESAGFRGAQALDMVRQSAELAQVGHANLEKTTQAVIGSLAAFGDRGLTAAQAVSILNATVGAGDMRMEGLAEAMSTGILPAARTVGLSLTDVGAALATITDNATPPEEAATRLRMTFAQMAAPTHAAQVELEKIGLSGTQLAEDMRQPNGLLVAMTDLKSHLEGAGLSAVEQAQVITRAFGGGRSSAAIETLLSEFDRFKDKYAAINQGANDFGQAWQETQQNVTFQWQQLQANVQTLGVVAGSALLPLANSVLNVVLPRLQQLTVWMQGPGGAAISAFSKIVSGLATEGLGSLGIHFDQTKGASNLFNDAMKTIGPILKDAEKMVVGFVSTHKEQFKDMIETTRQIMSALSDLIHAVLGAIRQFWHDHGQQVMTILSLAFNFIVGVVSDAMHIILDIIHLITDIIKGDWHKVWQDVLDILKDAIKLIVDAIQNLIPLIWNVIKLGQDKLNEIGRDIISGIVTGIADGAGWIYNALKKALGDAWNQLKSDFGISSPSKVASDEFGAPLMQGAALGITGNSGLVKNALSSATSNLFGGSGGGLSAVGVGGGSIIIDMRGSYLMTDRDIDLFAQKLLPVLGRAAVRAGIKFRV